MRRSVIGGLIIIVQLADCCSNLATGAPSIKVENGLIAFTLKDRAGRLQIFTQKPDGSNRHQLTLEGDNGRPDWSPDGKKIVYGSIKDGRSWVAVMDADGSNQRMVAEGSPDPDWSPDGKQMAFSHPSMSADGHLGSQIWLMNAGGSNLRQITRSSTFKSGPSWSPDGTQMVFILVKNPGSPTDPQPQIGIMNADGTNERILTTEKRVNVRREPDGTATVLETANDANAPAWSPVGNRIAFWSGIENRYGQVWTIHSDGTKSIQLTEDPTHRNSDDPSWSPDGKKILFSTGRSGRNELWVMDADGSNERKLSDIDAFPFPGRASWQPLRGEREERQ
jgi:TolB protein